MNHKRTLLALISAFTLFAAAGTAVAGVTTYEGSREQLREMCQKLHGELVETTSKTRCNLVTGVIYICKTSGHCVKQDPLTGTLEQVPDSGGGGSLSTPHTGTFYEMPSGVIL